MLSIGVKLLIQFTTGCNFNGDLEKVVFLCIGCGLICVLVVGVGVYISGLGGRIIPGYYAFELCCIGFSGFTLKP